MANYYVFNCGCIAVGKEDSDDWAKYVPEGHKAIAVDRICKDCESTAIAEAKFAPAPSIQSMVFAHGTNADMDASYIPSVQEIVNRTAAISEIKGKICCTLPHQLLPEIKDGEVVDTLTIGNVGVFIKGNVTIAAKMDIFTHLNSKGIRSFDASRYHRSDYIVTKRDLEEYLSYTERGDYAEILVKNTQIVGIWVLLSSTPMSLYKEMEKLADQFEVPLIEVDDEDTSYDDYHDFIKHYLP